jgi:hypothetical protein
MALFRRLQRVHAEFINVGNDVDARRVRRFIRRAIEEYVNISTVPRKIHIQYAGDSRIDSPEIQDGMIAADRRFKTRNQLTRLAVGFDLPAFFVLPCGGYRFHGEELLLIALERCSFGERYLDLQQKYKIHYETICRGANYFAEWMRENWGYLLRDNLEFWSECQEESKDAIKAKMLLHYYFDVEAHDQEEFKVSMFIDCTTVAVVCIGDFNI